MATANSTPVPGLPGKLPFFDLCERSGKYTARRELTPDQIIRAAKAALAARCARGTVLTSPEASADYLIIHSRKPAEVFTCQVQATDPSSKNSTARLLLPSWWTRTAVLTLSADCNLRGNEQCPLQSSAGD